MYRKAYQELLNWKNEEKGKCAIMIDSFSPVPELQ